MIPKTHEYLFYFLDADFSRLEAYVRSYLACIDTQASKNSILGDPLILQRMFEELFAIHPYYRTCPSGAAALLNSVFAGYVRKVIPDETELQMAMMKRVCTDKYLGEKNVEHWLENPACVSDDCLFDSLYELQQNLLRWVFIFLDNSNPDLAALTGQQRGVVYSLIFGGEYVPLLETHVEKTIMPPRSISAISAALDFDEDFLAEAMQGISDMQKDPTASIPDSIRRILDSAGDITEDCERHSYITDTLEDLLKYEVYTMTQNEIRVKDRVCILGVN